jgi:ABC-2 type transport system ATP-binding protein
MEEVIRVEDLRVVYRIGFLARPKVAVDGATFSVRHNEVFGYIGANGAGKTTTIKTLVGLQRPTAGQASLGGEDVRRAASRARVGFLPENPYFYEYLTAREALRFYGELCDVPSPVIRERTGELLELVHLQDAADRSIRGYSKGMRQRLGVAQALINDPELVILDEPMTGLDPLGRAQIREVILDLAARGKTVFFSTHILSDVEAICSRVGLIHNGKIQAVGQLANLLRREVTSVELTVAAVPAETQGDLAAGATRQRVEGDTHYLTFADEDAAQHAAAAVIQAGGRVVALIPHRQSLEDLFLASAGPAKEVQP